MLDMHWVTLEHQKYCHLLRQVLLDTLLSLKRPAQFSEHMVLLCKWCLTKIMHTCVFYLNNTVCLICPTSFHQDQASPKDIPH